MVRGPVKLERGFPLFDLFLSSHSFPFAISDPKQTFPTISLPLSSKSWECWADVDTSTMKSPLLLLTLLGEEEITDEMKLCTDETSSPSIPEIFTFALLRFLLFCTVNFWAK